MHSIRVIVILGCLTCCVLPGLAFSQEPAFESLLVSAQQAQAKGDFESAAAFYRKAVAVHPELAELQANLGLMYFQTGKDEAAIEAFGQALHRKPGLFVPNLFLGLDYVKLKRFKQALPYLKRAALSRPTDIQAQIALGQAYTGCGKTRPAIASYLRAVQLERGNADAWFHLGVSYLEQVEADARILLTRHQNSGYLQALMADTFAEQRALIQAAEAYRKALAFPDRPPGMHAAFGFVLMNQHDFAGAERELNVELASTPGSLMAKLGVALLQVEQGANLEAAKGIADIWKADANFLRANAGLFNGGLPQSKRSELQHRLEQQTATGEVPEGVLSLFQIGANAGKSTEVSHGSSIPADRPARPIKIPTSPATELYASGRYGECSNQLASRLQPLSPKDLQLLAFCAYATANYQTAADASQKLALHPDREAEGLYWETKSAQKLAIEALARASEIDSGSPKMHVLLGDLYRQRKYYPDAEQEYRKALALQPEDTGALFGLSLALLADSDIEEALRLAQAALKKDADDPEFNAVMGEILSARHDFSAAEPYLKKGLNTKPELVPHVHALLARVFAETNRTQEAIAELKLGLADDKDGRLHYQMARLYLKVGDRDAAKRAFEVSARMRKEGLTRAAVAMQQGEDNSESR